MGRIGLLGLSAALALACAGSLLAQQTPAPDPDDRTPVSLSRAERAYVLEQMRLFLLSVETIAGGLAEGNRAAASEAAAARGARRNASDPAFPSTLAAKLPDEWKRIGGGLRKGFDVLAEKVAADGTLKEPLAQLSAVMKSCAACHATYRIVAVK